MPNRGKIRWKISGFEVLLRVNIRTIDMGGINNTMMKTDNILSRKLILKTTSAYSLGFVFIIFGGTSKKIKNYLQLGNKLYVNLNSKSDNKIGYIYLLTPSGALEKAKITRDFLARKEIEYQQLKHEIQQLKSEVKQF